jgi:anti-sigma factor RsiW
MKCKQAQDLIGAYIYGDLAAEEMRDLRVHTQDCALCREDLASRGRIISALDDTVPMLTDEERLRIAWSVKGAVRKEQ